MPGFVFCLPLFLSADRTLPNFITIRRATGAFLLYPRSKLMTGCRNAFLFFHTAATTFIYFLPIFFASWFRTLNQNVIMLRICETVFIFVPAVTGMECIPLFRTTGRDNRINIFVRMNGGLHLCLYRHFFLDSCIFLRNGRGIYLYAKRICPNIQTSLNVFASKSMLGFNLFAITLK